jgi:tetratricopeptide (TPR) repeat protein
MANPTARNDDLDELLAFAAEYEGFRATLDQTVSPSEFEKQIIAFAMDAFDRENVGYPFARDTATKLPSRVPTSSRRRWWPMAAAASLVASLLVMLAVLFPLLPAVQTAREPARFQHYLNEAHSWEVEGNLDQAIAAYGEAIRLRPSDPRTYMYRGNAYRQQAEFDRAIADYSAAIRLESEYADAYVNRGKAWQVKGEYDRATGDFSQALRLDPDDAEAHRSFAEFLATCSDAGLRDGPKAVEFARRACELTGWEDARCLSTLAVAYAEAKDFAEAIKWQTKTVELATDEVEKQQGRVRLELYKADMSRD